MPKGSEEGDQVKRYSLSLISALNLWGREAKAPMGKNKKEGSEKRGTPTNSRRKRRRLKGGEGCWGKPFI